MVNGEYIVAKNSNFGQLSSDVITKINAYVMIPEGDWDLLVVVDSNQTIWELDEQDNNYTKSYSTASSMFGTIVAGVGGGLAVLILLGVLFIRRKNGLEGDLSSLDVGDIQPQENEVKETPELSTSATEPAPKPKRVGPPRKGPPPKKKVEPTPQSEAQSHFSALDSLLPSTEEPVVDAKTFAKDYSELPGGGEYEYTTEGTYYVGETCGRWILNADQSFSKVE